MILADTSVWIDHFNNKRSSLYTLLIENRIVTHSFIIGELACGQFKNRKEIFSLMNALHAIPTATQEEILFFIEEHHLFGKGLGLIDIHLLVSAYFSGSVIVTHDKRLQQVAEKFRISFKL